MHMNMQRDACVCGDAHVSTATTPQRESTCAATQSHNHTNTDEKHLEAAYFVVLTQPALMVRNPCCPAWLMCDHAVRAVEHDGTSAREEGRKESREARHQSEQQKQKHGETPTVSAGVHLVLRSLECLSDCHLNTAVRRASHESLPLTNVSASPSIDCTDAAAAAAAVAAVLVVASVSLSPRRPGAVGVDGGLTPSFSARRTERSFIDPCDLNDRRSIAGDPRRPRRTLPSMTPTALSSTYPPPSAPPSS